jgi:hypothetical protein
LDHAARDGKTHLEVNKTLVRSLGHVS